MTQAYNRIIATITTASDASQVVKAMVKSTQWRAGTSGNWNTTDCTLTASNVYQFRTPLSGLLVYNPTAILPDIKASVVVDWDVTATAIATVGNYFMNNYANGCTSLTSLSVPDTSGLTTVGTYFMYYYANGCTSLTSLSVPDTSGLTTVGSYFMRYYANGCTSLTSLLLPSTTGWFTSNNVSWAVPSERLGSLKGYAPNSAAQTAWQALTVSGKTLYMNYIQSEDDVEVTSAGSNDYTLTCAAGSYSLTGTNVTLTHTPASQNLTLACNAGSYALTGTNADLTVTRHYTLTCGAGSYSLTGTNADLTVKRNYVLNLAYPDIIVSGAGTPVEYVNGTYSFAGMQDGKPSYSAPLDGWNGIVYWADLGGSYGWMITTAGNGSEFYSTDDVATPDLVTTWIDGGYGAASLPTLTATNAYKLTGSDATLTVQRNYTLVCESGSYTLTGTDITFGNTTAYTLTCEAGAYALTGSSVSFIIQRNYSLACETGSYSLTGTDVTLTYTQGAQNFTLACETGSYALTGTNAGLTSARTMALESGSYALTGTNADFYRALVMACEAGSYALTGTDATFNANYVFALGVGSYVLVGTSVGLFILTPTPACRTYTIDAEGRLYTIAGDNRTYAVLQCTDDD